MTTDRGRIRKHSLEIAGHRTSVSLEDAFWEAFTETARIRGVSVNRLAAEIDRARTGNLSSAIRLFVLDQTSRLNGP
ncbi:MAG: ribbon-helix-helix domain-containing protein [Rhodospirillales bacterium]|nr:ribbon-helix-helix domain-containing protein [Rhodospirillales bacterium]